MQRVVLDVPLLLENDARHGFVRLCSALVFVEADLGHRDQRAQRSRSWKPGEVTRREASQLPLAEKRERADFVVQNDGTPAELEAQVARILARISTR